jgi:hypothetical protein
MRHDGCSSRTHSTASAAELDSAPRIAAATEVVAAATVATMVKASAGGDTITTWTMDPERPRAVGP